MTSAQPASELTVGIATAGRPSALRELLRVLRKQTLRPDRIVISAPTLQDVGGKAVYNDPRIELIIGEKGLTRQRNAILAASTASALVVFFDDDFIPAPDYLECARHLFSADPQIVMSTGKVLADGITGPGLSAADALRLISRTAPATDRLRVRQIYNGYGCNMVVRMSAISGGKALFDEGLPFYGWLEDVDFSRTLAALGDIVLSEAQRGVHLGIKSGRQPGLRLGYSQVANPIYLIRKGTMSWERALWLLARNLAMNLLFALTPEPFVDRAGRLRGNVKAIAELFTGELHPERIRTL